MSKPKLKESIEHRQDVFQPLLEVCTSADFKRLTVQDIVELLSDPRLQDLLKLIKVLTPLLSSSAFKVNVEQNNKEMSKEDFIRNNAITDHQIKAVTELIKGTPLNGFSHSIGISESAANKLIRKLWTKLGLKNHRQLIYIFGKLDLLEWEFECLKKDEKDK